MFRTERERVEALLSLAQAAAGRRDPDLDRTARAGLAAASPATVRAEIERSLISSVRLLWANGWQPTELVRHARRSVSAAGARLARFAVGAERFSRAGAAVDPRWEAQEAELDLPPVGGSSGWYGAWEAEIDLSVASLLTAAVDLVVALSLCSPLETLIPPPGSDRARFARTVGGATAEADPVLAKVRALLSQAESTTFDAEAEAFTAKAQELITRHAIDQALLHGTASPSGEAPETIRVPVDEPYADAKSLLVQLIAENMRCRAVFHPGCSLSSVVGFAADLRAVEMLFTSLLVQAQAALGQASASAPPGARSRRASFRSSFWLAYAHRIGDRLAEVNAQVMTEAEADMGPSFLPVLASRQSRVDETYDTRWSSAQALNVRGGYDSLGYVSGQMAADRARLTSGDLSASDGSASTSRSRPDQPLLVPVTG